MSAYRDPPRTSPLFDPTDAEPYINEDWFQWHLDICGALNRGVTTVVPLAKITGGGADGSLTITNGLVTAVTQPT